MEGAGEGAQFVLTPLSRQVNGTCQTPYVTHPGGIVYILRNTILVKAEIKVYNCKNNNERRERGIGRNYGWLFRTGRGTTSAETSTKGVRTVFRTLPGLGY